MKRIISLCCVALILVSSIAVPVRADDISNEVMIDLLDYSSVNESGNFFNFTGSTIVGLKIPYVSNLFYCDIIFVSNAALSGIRASWQGQRFTNLNIVSIGNNLYRAYGALPAGNYHYLDLYFDGLSSASIYYMTMLSCNVSTIPVEHFQSDGYCDIVSSLYTNTIHYVPTDTINYRYVDASNQVPYECEFTLHLTASDWKKYDYIDFSLLLSCESITSVSASCGDVLLDYQVSEIENSSLELKDFRLYARLDLTGIDRTTSDVPSIVVTGQWAPKWVNLVQVLGCSGFVDVNSSNPVYYYFRNLISIFSTGFINLNSWISNQTSSLTGALSSHFSNLNSWIDNQTVRLESAIRGDTSPGNEFQHQVYQKDQELDEMAAVMDSVTKPNIDQIDVSVDRFVSQADVQILASPMAVFFEGEIFSKIIIMSILLATVSYVLYGKR